MQAEISTHNSARRATPTSYVWNFLAFRYKHISAVDIRLVSSLVAGGNTIPLSFSARFGPPSFLPALLEKKEHGTEAQGRRGAACLHCRERPSRKELRSEKSILSERESRNMDDAQVHKRNVNKQRA